MLRVLVASARRFAKQGRRPDLLSATGDVGFSGRVGEHANATRVFDDLLDATGLGRERLFVIPGNHDIGRNRTTKLRDLWSAKAPPGRSAG